MLAPVPHQGTGGSQRRYRHHGYMEACSKPALISAQRHQCHTGRDVSLGECQGSSHGVLSQREIDIISNTQLWREEGEAEKRIPSCTFRGGKRRRLNSALAILEEAEGEDVPDPYSHHATRLGGAGDAPKQTPFLAVLFTLFPKELELAFKDYFLLYEHPWPAGNFGFSAEEVDSDMVAINSSTGFFLFNLHLHTPKKA